MMLRICDLCRQGPPTELEAGLALCSMCRTREAQSGRYWRPDGYIIHVLPGPVSVVSIELSGEFRTYTSPDMTRLPIRVPDTRRTIPRQWNVRPPGRLERLILQRTYQDKVGRVKLKAAAWAERVIERRQRHFKQLCDVYSRPYGVAGDHEEAVVWICADGHRHKENPKDVPNGDRPKYGEECDLWMIRKG